MLTTKRMTAFVIAVGLMAIAAFSALKADHQKPGGTAMWMSAVDVGYLQSMLIHHGQAIEMALMMLDSESIEIRRFANNILMTQTKESGVYQGWLSMQGEKTMAPRNPMQWVEQVASPLTLADRLYQDRCRSIKGQMPGVPSPSQIKQLMHLKGEAKDKLFLELMIAHHEAALPMAKFAQNNGSSTLIKGAAWGVISSQRIEIGLMQQAVLRMSLNNITTEITETKGQPS